MRLWLAIGAVLLINSGDQPLAFAQSQVQSHEQGSVNSEEKLHREAVAIATYFQTAEPEVRNAWRMTPGVKNDVSAISRIAAVADAKGKIVSVKLAKASGNEEQDKIATKFVSSLTLPCLPNSLKSLQLHLMLGSDGSLGMCEGFQSPKEAADVLTRILYALPSPPVGKSAAESPDRITASEPDLAPYLRKVQQRLKLARARYKSLNGKKVIVTFQIGKSGQISNLSILQSSGSPPADKAALTAVREASPFTPPPPGAPPFDMQFCFDK